MEDSCSARLHALLALTTRIFRLLEAGVSGLLQKQGLTVKARANVKTVTYTRGKGFRCSIGRSLLIFCVFGLLTEAPTLEAKSPGEWGQEDRPQK
jgi:hypothetical protein